VSLESIRQQLDLEKRAFGYTYGPPDTDGYMTEKLAAHLVRKGVEDIRDISLFDGGATVPKQFGTNADGSPIMGVAFERVKFLYDARSGVRLTPAESGWGGVDDPLVIYVDGPGKWRVWMHTKFTTDRVPYFVPEVELMGSAGVFSGAMEGFAPVLPFLAIALAIMVPGLGAAIGSAILPASFIAAAPALVPIIGNVALSTAFNGGDIEAAVIGALTGSLGGAVGGAASTASGSALIGKLAGTATSAALRGGDIKAAVAGTLLSKGAQETMARLGDSWGADAAPVESWEAFDWSVPVPQGDFTTYADAQFEFARTSAADYFDPVYDAPATQQASSPYAFDPFGMDKPAALPAPVSGGGGEILVTLTNAALAAIRVNQAYQASKAPAPRTSTASGTTVRTPNANGTVTVRNTATGQTAIARPEVGVPYTLADGRTILNNGNGTYTMVQRDGATQTLAYSTSSSSSSGLVDTLTNVPPWVWGLGATGLLLALRSRPRSRSYSRGRRA